eukprot:CAMPEP_0196698822 /NCGR_PEP_ID=MMETSP1090-20130531/45554_1 /TAXON_ID=37098 /ORGANISM="Isochrysis sp, Strain CCMP1244" /LENGTH=107 /DNA_ID=CAMNT_0042038491 /DNA_START=32 /DNA_END=352 /DNA_ORIENTATION=+
MTWRIRASETHATFHAHMVPPHPGTHTARGHCEPSESPGASLTQPRGATVAEPDWRRVVAGEPAEEHPLVGGDRGARAPPARRRRGSAVHHNLDRLPARVDADQVGR